MHKKIFIIGLLLAMGLFLSACAAPEAPECPDCPEVDCPETECPECPAVDCPDCPDCPAVECPACPEAESVLPGIEAAWAGSGHADSEAEAFRHWDEDDPAVVSPACSKCHSSAGYIDFHGADGSEAGVINNAEVPAAENMGVECEACHNKAVAAKDSVVMPSGIELTGLGSEARCMECHQGRHSSVSLNASIAEAAGVEDASEADADMVYEELGFANIHYYAAAATKYGTLAKGGSEYPGKTYDGNFAHVEEFDTCVECHSPHTLEVRAESCAHCHGEGEYSEYRMLSSAVDYNGNGDIEEGIASEIEGLKDVLYGAIQAYAADVAGTPIVYDSHAYPYFFIDTNGDGESSEDEANYGNKYASWTPRLLRAAYNYQVSMKDPGGFAHGGKYIIQLAYDSIEDLGGDVSTLNRDDHGHFQGSAEAFRHWDEDGDVSANCARCHSASGLPTFHKEGVNITAEISNGFLCETCHGDGDWPARFVFDSVTFPSGLSAAVAEGDESGLCMQCHQGRSSGVTVAARMEGLPPDEVAESLGFSNIHYFPAGATRYGADVAAGFQFEGKEYVGYFPHVPGFEACTDCHDAHELEVQTDQCFTCHAGVESVEDIRMSDVDYDGDGDVTTGLYTEISNLKDALYPALQTYATEVVGVGILYDSHSYPYFFTDTNGNGAADPDEINYGNRYATWTPNLLAAAYNYQYASKEPGAYAHNGQYMAQLLYDSIQAVGGDVSTYTRP